MATHRNNALEGEKRQVPQNATTAGSMDITSRTARNEGNRGSQDVNQADPRQSNADCAPETSTSKSDLGTAKRLINQESNSKGDSKSTSARTSAPSDSNLTFKKDGTVVIYKTEESPVQIIDPAMPIS